MGTLNEDLNSIKTVESTITSNKVANFAYTDTAYTSNDADGVSTYDVDQEQNIPTADPDVLKVNATVLTKGYRAQASAITRMLMNHFLGRVSYNLNKVNDNVASLIQTLIDHSGTANGFATLDSNVKIPYEQISDVVFTNLAPAFSDTTAYTVGKYVTYNGKLYKCTTAHSAGSFTASHFTEVKVSTHMENTSNPHGVTKTQVGLGNVPNVTTNNQTPTYTASSSNVNLTSGETLSVAFGKIAKAVSSLISHLSNTSNPHSVTKAQVGLGSVLNTGDSATPLSGGTTKFTTGGAYTELAKKQDNVIEITQAEYDALSDSDKEGNLFVITDATSYPATSIKDSTTASDSTWSSAKISTGILYAVTNSTTITGGTLYNGAVIRVMFTSAITGSNTTTALSLTYNGTAYTVKVGKQGSLSNFVASYVDSAYTYLQAYTTLELAFDGTQFIIIGNPVVLSSSDYTIYADGNKSYKYIYNKNEQITQNVTKVIDLTDKVNSKCNYRLVITGNYNAVFYCEYILSLNMITNKFNVITVLKSEITVTSTEAYKLNIYYAQSTSNYTISITEC